MKRLTYSVLSIFVLGLAFLGPVAGAHAEAKATPPRKVDDKGKLFFNILDYTGSATRLFADPDFDGEPSLATVESIDDEGKTIEGSEKVMKFATRCNSLEAFGLLSTVYASGLRSGMIAEVPFEAAGNFANHYERSKCASETKLMRDFDYLPWRILRVATVVADDASGRVTQFNAFHNTLKLLYYGLLSIIPGKQDTPLYFVTGDFVTDAVFNLMRNPANKAIYNVCHTRPESLNLGELIDAAFDCFAGQPDFKSRRIMKPLYADAESFDMLGSAMDSFGGSIVNQALSSVSPFARQLFIEKEFLNDKLVAALPGYVSPDQRQVIRHTCEYLVRTRWGKEESK